MRRFDESRARACYLTGGARGVPNRIALRAHRMLHLLLACHSWDDVTVVGPVIHWKTIGRFGLFVDKKWHIMFDWVEDFGATEISLERR
jgi:plasmid maintenance system killer protein